MEAGIKTTLWDFQVKAQYVNEWFFMGSALLMLCILVSYLFFVLKCGPKFMENRPAYKLKNILLAYNAFQVLYSIYLFNIGTRLLLEKGIVENGFCAMDDESFKAKILSGHYLYFIGKLTELLDTIFFVLRKKWNQVTFLHVYHHSIMYLMAWLTLKYEPSYSFVFLGNINCFVHVLMYGYYGLSAFPGLEKYLWWKKYITKLQLIQFALILIHVTWNHRVTTCPPSYFLITLAWLHLCLFIYLFSQFYIKSYIQNKENKKNRTNKETKDLGVFNCLTRSDDKVTRRLVDKTL